MSESRLSGAACHGGGAPDRGTAGAGSPGSGNAPTGPGTPSSLDEALERVSLAVEAGRAGWWEWDTTANVVTWSPEVWALYDADPRSVSSSYEAWKATLHPDDVAPAEAALAAAVAAGDDIQLEWRVRTRDGSERWLMTRGRPKRSGETRPGLYVGIVMDVTDLHGAREARRSSEELLALAFRSSPAAISISRLADGIVLEVNEAWTRLVGIGRDEAVGRSLLDLGIYVDPEARRAFVRAVEADGHARGHEAGLRSRNGDLRHVILAGERIRVDGVDCVLSVLEDVTGRRRAEEALRESEARYRAFFDSPVVGTLQGDVHGGIVAANDEFLRIVGYTREDLAAGRIRWDALTPPEFLPLDDAGIAEAREKGSCAPYEKQYVRKDGSLVWVLVGFALVGERREESVAFILDISRQKAALEAVAASEGRYRGTLDAMLEGCQILGHDWRYLYVNAAAEVHNRRPTGELLGRSYPESWPGIEGTEVFALIRRGLEERLPGSMENFFTYPDGRTGWFEIKVYPVSEGVVVLSVDITERKVAEEALASSEERFRALFEQMTQGVVYQERDGRITDANPAAQRILGLSLDRLQGRTSLDPRWQALDEHGEPLAGDRHPAMRALASGQVVSDFRQGIFNPERDEIRWLSVSSVPELRPGEETPFRVFSTFDDVTERRLAEEALRESEVRFRSLFENMTAGFVLFEVVPDGNGAPEDLVILAANRGFEATTGLRSPEYLGRRLTDVLPGIEKDAADWIGTYGRVALGGEPRQLEMGSELIGAHFTIAAFRPAPGLCAVTFTDTTARMRAEAEIRTLNESLEARVKERTEELEGFSYSVSHDLRAPLRAIDGFARLLEEEHAASLDEEGLRLLGVVRRNARQMGELIDDLLAFSRVGRAAMNPGRVEMEALARAAWAELGADASRAAFAAGPLPDVHGDAGLLRQVWVNLLSNAVKFSARAESPRVEVSASAADGRVTFSVRDNGVGFDPAYGEKLFHVFQRLHSPREFPGTGVGLALVERIVRRHGGSVSAEGNPGAGATFRFTLPVREVTS